jgi:AmmeMemoRadiSam system protein A
MTSQDAPPGVSPPALTVAERQTLLEQARRALEAGLSGRPFRGEASSGAPAQVGAAFVTLRHRRSRELRGCCGETEARRSLAESVCEMALASALSDPRFPAVTHREIDALSIEITVLGPMAPIEAARIEVGRHGLMIRRGARRGLLLPQVAIENRWDRSMFLAAICRKAGLWPGAWVDAEAELLAFEALWWGEAGDGPSGAQGVESPRIHAGRGARAGPPRADSG